MEMETIEIKVVDRLVKVRKNKGRGLPEDSEFIDSCGAARIMFHVDELKFDATTDRRRVIAVTDSYKDATGTLYRDFKCMEVSDINKQAQLVSNLFNHSLPRTIMSDTYQLPGLGWFQRTVIGDDVIALDVEAYLVGCNHYGEMTSLTWLVLIS